MSSSLTTAGNNSSNGGGNHPINGNATNSVFDTMTSSIRNNVARSAQSLVNSWSECAYVINYTRYTSYVLTVVLVFTLIALIFKWNIGIVWTLVLIANLCTAMLVYLVSQGSCFKIFQPVSD